MDECPICAGAEADDYVAYDEGLGEEVELACPCCGAMQTVRNVLTIPVRDED